MKYIKNINLFQESKLINLQANEDELWEEPTPVEMGTSAAEQVIKDFDVRTDPEALSINHPDEVVFGVRSQMMQGPFRGTGNKILSAKELHNERVINRLRDVCSNAPDIYRHIIDEEYRRRASAPSWKRTPWQRIKHVFKSRRSIEEEIAADFFTYDIGQNETYENLRARIQNWIVTLGLAKAGSFRDANNQPVNFSDINATNEFVVATGAASSFRNERVVIKWHEDDYFQIRKKLERAKLWGEFSRTGRNSTPDQNNVRKFIHLKFRLSLLDKITAEEKTKLNNDRFNTERLQGWLDDDKTTQALHDTEMQDFITTNNINRDYASFEELENTNPDLNREFSNKIDELREKNKENTLEYYLSRILPPEELAHMHDSLETRTMLAYLQGAAQDSEQGINVRNYLRQLAGISDLQGKKEGQEEYDNAQSEYVEHKDKYDENKKELKDKEDELNKEYDNKKNELKNEEKGLTNKSQAVKNLQTQNQSDSDNFRKEQRTYEYNLNELTEQKDLINYFISTYQGEFTNYSKTKVDLESVKSKLSGPQNLNQKQRTRLEQEKEKLQSQLNLLISQLIQKIRDFIILMHEKENEGDQNFNTINILITQDPLLNSNPSNDIKNYLDKFNEYLFEVSFFKGLKTIKKNLSFAQIDLEDKRSDKEEALKKQKEELNKQKEELDKLTETLNKSKDDLAKFKELLEQKLESLQPKKDELKTMKEELKKMKKELDKQKEELDNLPESGYEKSDPTKMDSRNLLTAIIKLDLKKHGVTESEKLNKHALFAADLAIARLENSEIYANVNQHMVDDYESGTINRTKDSLSATRFFTPVLSAQDAIEHVVDTDSDLLMFSEITRASTRSDLQDIIDKYDVGPAKLKEFIAKLAFCIKGIEVSPTGKSLFGKLPYKLGRLFGFSMKNKEKSLGVRLLSHEVPQVENLINTLTLLSAEYSTKRYYAEAKQQAEMEPEKTFDEHYLDMINQQTSDARELNQAIEKDLKDPEHPLKTHLDFHRMRDRAYAALDQVKYIKDPAEYERELIKLGVSPRELTRGMISLRTRRFFRKSARVGLTGLSLPFYIPYGIGLGLGKMGKWFGKEILLSEGTKKGSKMAWENIKATLETPQQIVGIPLFALTMALSWPTKKLREINKKLKD